MKLNPYAPPKLVVAMETMRRCARKTTLHSGRASGFLVGHGLDSVHGHGAADLGVGADSKGIARPEAVVSAATGKTRRTPAQARSVHDQCFRATLRFWEEAGIATRRRLGGIHQHGG